MTSTGGIGLNRDFGVQVLKAANISRVGVISHTENYYNIETCEEQHDSVSVSDIFNRNFLKRHMRKKN